MCFLLLCFVIQRNMAVDVLNAGRLVSIETTTLAAIEPPLLLQRFLFPVRSLGLRVFQYLEPNILTTASESPFSYLCLEVSRISLLFPI